MPYVMRRLAKSASAFSKTIRRSSCESKMMEMELPGRCRSEKDLDFVL